ncbi:MAG: alkaline phosphatase family protein [Rhodothermales bacterium]|nr:alkaline phosphatase family protein [Rhodothermales bacterium]MBO6778195.1 alkaline phosphatase family protein [Rhodothermales bacterium]
MRVLPLLVLFLVLATAPSHAQETRVVLVTLDGLRWEEVFRGMDPSMTEDESLLAEFGVGDAAERRTTLMPWLWRTLATQGVLLGNRQLGSTGRVTNGHVFSYPGYNEILTGRVDERIDSNDKVPNPNVTVLEWLQTRAGVRAAAFGSWDVFPYIINEERSGIPVNAGFEPSLDPERSERESFLNELQAQIPSPWGTVRLDAFTHHYALEYMKRASPEVVYISYGETDDFAHNDNFPAYIRAARNTDAFLQGLWTFLQTDSAYAGRTSLIITTDHGRGSGDGWVGHGTGEEWAGSEYIWLAALGPSIPAGGELRGVGFDQAQVAATVAALMGFDFTITGAAPPISAVVAPRD